MVTSADEGMSTLEAALAWLVRNGLVAEADAVGRSMFPDEVTSHHTPYAPFQSAFAEEVAPPPLSMGVPSA